MAAHQEYRRTGRPIMCALELAYPGSGPVWDQYLLGTDLLVAPVLEPGANSRRVVLPPGSWVGLFDGTELEGPGEVEVAVNLAVDPRLPPGRRHAPAAARPRPVAEPYGGAAGVGRRGRPIASDGSRVRGETSRTTGMHWAPSPSGRGGT
jgi:Glycosyl hydrolases family 31